ncbi:MAG: oxidoreductase [Pseudomonadota bacterium]
MQNPVQLPCGVVLKNRLVKSAMSDSLGDGRGNPTKAQIRLYERWAEGGAALSIIGEVQGDHRFAEKPGNLVFRPQSDRKAIGALIRRGLTNKAHLWPQLGHAGALSHPPISQPKGPSALNMPGLSCAALSTQEVEALPDHYARTAIFAKKAGLSGVHLHAGHGFLLSQFLSPLFNQRSDAYGGQIDGRASIIIKIINAIRCAVGPAFPVGIRINASDRLEGGLTEGDALEFVRLLDQTSIDLIDISGGTYFPGAKPSLEGRSNGKPYFLDFARRARTVTEVPLMLTGGIATRAQALDAITSGAADLIGLARAMVLNPNLANDWLSKAGGDPAVPQFDSPPPGSVTAWYTMRITALGEDTERSFAMDPAMALDSYEARDHARCHQWRTEFCTAPEPN